MYIGKMKSNVEFMMPFSTVNRVDFDNDWPRICVILVAANLKKHGLKSVFSHMLNVVSENTIEKFWPKLF